METFIPDSNHSQLFRQALGSFTTGVTLITALAPESIPTGMTANSFTSVSLDPPFILWCPAKSSQRFQIFMEAQHFAIHVLRQEQQSLAHHFTKNGQDFSMVDWDKNEHATPILKDYLTCFECSQHTVHDAGDHCIIVGAVEKVSMQSGSPLLFFGGQYQNIQD